MYEQIIEKNIDKDEINDEIDRRIKLLPRCHRNLSYREKRALVIRYMENEYEAKNQKEFSENLNIPECLDLQNNTIILFDIPKIRKAREAELEQKISLINDINLTYEEKRLKVLNELNSSETFEYIEEKEKKNEQSIDNESKLGSTKEVSKIQKLSESTKEDSKIQELSESTKEDSTQKDSDFKIQKEFWINSEYYDKSLLFGKAPKKGMKEIELDDKSTKYTAYSYNNNLNTYNFAISQKILNTYKMDDIITKGKTIDNFNSEYGLCFCGKNIEKDIYCKPGQMICKNCMEKNKEYYGLNEHKSALININGRVACKFNDGLYHCLGKFEVGNNIKNCANKEFCCKACEELNKNIEYYKGKK